MARHSRLFLHAANIFRPFSQENFANCFFCILKLNKSQSVDTSIVQFSIDSFDAICIEWCKLHEKNTLFSQVDPMLAEKNENPYFLSIFLEIIPANFSFVKGWRVTTLCSGVFWRIKCRVKEGKDKVVGSCLQSSLILNK